jgi:hypothetical protein
VSFGEDFVKRMLFVGIIAAQVMGDPILYVLFVTICSILLQCLTFHPQTMERSPDIDK